MDFFKIEFLGNPLEYHFISLSLIVVAALAAALLNRFIKTYAYSLTARTETDLDDRIVKNLITPMTNFIFIIGAAAAVNMLKMPEHIREWINRILLAVSLAIFFFLLIRIIELVIELVAARYLKGVAIKAPEKLESETLSVERKKRQATEVSKMVIAAMAVLTILSNLGFNLKAIWASLGIGGIAVAFAVQEPLKNIVGRIYIYSTGLFDEGHFIQFGSWSGTVMKIGTFRTEVEIFSDMTKVSIPNADFIKNPLTNYYGRTKFMFNWDLGVIYETPPEKINELITELRNLILERPETNRDRCWIYLDRLDDFSKVIKIWFQVNLDSWGASLYYGSDVLHDIQKLFERMGVSFAFPTQTLHLETNLPMGAAGVAPVVVPEVVKEGEEEPATKEKKEKPKPTRAKKTSGARTKASGSSTTKTAKSKGSKTKGAGSKSGSEE
jgi:MscS family membrane protein